MYAIVEIAGQQFKVAKDQRVFVHRLAGEEGDSVSFDKVLLAGDGDDITLGAPAIEGALVGAKITRHLKGDKVIVFKKKRRKGYRVKNGHRQSLTEIVIEDISLKGEKKSSKKAEPKKTEAKKAASKPVKEDEVSENLITRAEHRVEGDMEINVDKLLHSIGTAAKADAEDLKEINGIGPAYEAKLNEIGIYTYEQISKLKAADREALSAIDGITRDKIEADEWVKQAKQLLKNK
ncbi:50S ribosomal protein L21 [Mesonia sp. MT50]|uniref:Large ribosomal subunit protein bL21 n=1 Tax=Mesonia profundi TaxID=3070998 RepID=A0ABU1A4Q6_9FLAO|nr:50S ribosomal protein L21 [Mesonia profundi]MDQ7918675.1 50S ribosomal protein L21 [Mesonia profundi]